MLTSSPLAGVPLIDSGIHLSCKWGIGVYGVDKWGVPVYHYCMQAVTMSGTTIAPVVPLHSSCQNGVALLYPNGTVILPNGVRVNIPYDPAFNTSIAIWNG